MTKKDDLAGQMLGWSIGTGIDEKAVKELLELPCIYSFKVIGESSETYQSEIISKLEEKLGRPLQSHEIESKNSSAKKYVSLTFKLYISTVEEIYSIYAVLKAHASTRFIL